MPLEPRVTKLTSCWTLAICAWLWLLPTQAKANLWLDVAPVQHPAPLTDANSLRAWQQQQRQVYREALLWDDYPTVHATLRKQQRLSLPTATPVVEPVAIATAGPDTHSETKPAPAPVDTSVTATLAPAAAATKTSSASYQVSWLTLQLTGQTQTEAVLLTPPVIRGAVLLLHDHGAFFSLGKEKWLPATLLPESQQADARRWQHKYFSGAAVAERLVAQGYLVLAADSPGFSSRGALRYDAQQQLASHLFATGHSLAGLAAAEDRQLARYLKQQLQQLAPGKKLISLGFSMGAFRAWQVAALEPDVDAAVAVSWFGRWQDLIFPGSNLDKGQSSFYFLHPGLNRQLDIPDLVSLIAPRPLYLLQGGQDPLFPAASVQAASRQLQQVWQLLGAEQALRTELWSEGKHEFPDAQQQQVLAWLNDLTQP